MKSTIVTSLLVSDGLPYQQDDVTLDVLEPVGFGDDVAIWFGYNQVRVGLSGAERIALIEALGGHDGPACQRGGRLDGPPVMNKSGWYRVCQQCWQTAYPDEYCPTLGRYDECYSCGEQGLTLGVQGREQADNVKRYVVIERDRAAIRAEYGDKPPHTVQGKADGPWPYGTKHDFKCPACLYSGTSYTSSPRSETYWAA